MTLRNEAALAFLLNRRSRPAKTLTGPAPSKDELNLILEAGTRVPDHGKLEPWRLKVLTKPTLDKLLMLQQNIVDQSTVTKPSQQKQLSNLRMVN